MLNCLEIFVFICTLIVLYNIIMVDHIILHINEIIFITIIFYIFIHLYYQLIQKLYFFKILFTNYYNIVLHHNVDTIEEIEEIIHNNKLEDSISSFYDSDDNNSDD